ncbi:hypothetical protein RXV86_04330 [Alisedimentitalea sp. MJ-SS2]|uniref:hypothetical protein n=1 Tax=Aliisedimentitalea sp. MJ-SS2 TaxID=3049795 RepID=UPI0029141924|nr:hypothetical protein [Alisedimentitalea sp. MJ-SS2]MDU8926605.1 hypothetical protein [Alisedimentitalea sp. MJ-SS2]
MRLLRHWAAVALVAAMALGLPGAGQSQMTVPDYDVIAGVAGTAAGGGAATWAQFLGEQPNWAGPLNHAVVAIQIHERLENGDTTGALNAFGTYSGGLLLQAWQDAGGAPWGSAATMFQGWVAANELVRDTFFLPQLVEAVYAPYEQARLVTRNVKNAEQASKMAWAQTRHAKGMNAVLGEVKRTVIRPKLGLDPDDPILSQAIRSEFAKVAGKELRVTWIPEDKWQFGRPILIRHKAKSPGGVPLFSRRIEVELTGDAAGLQDRLIYEIIRLNERYRDVPGYMSASELAVVETALGGMLQALARGPSDAEVGRQIDDMAAEHVRKVLEGRFARKHLVDAVEAAAQRGQNTAGRAMAAYRDWLAEQDPIEEPEGTPFMDMECCRWWEVNEGGRRVKGWYVNKDGDKVAYTSAPLAMFDPGFAGLFAGASGNGYHVYRTGTPGKTTHMIAVRLGLQPETLFDQTVSTWNCKPLIGGLSCAWTIRDDSGQTVLDSGVVKMR